MRLASHQPIEIPMRDQDAPQPASNPSGAKRFLAGAISGFTVALLIASYMHFSRETYWQGRMISHCAASLDEDQRFFMFPRGKPSC